VPSVSPAAAPSSVPNTVLDVTLSATLQTTLAQNGVSAYAVYFDQHDSNKAVFTTLADGGSVANGGNSSITLTKTVGGTFEGLNAGKIYFLMQSQPPGGGVDLTSVITKESDINWDSAATYDCRYDSFEVTLLNGPDDKGNLTSVNGFGLSMALSVNGENAGYKIAASDMFTTIATATGQTVDTFASGPLAGKPREAISPSVALVEGNAAFAPSDWDAYIDHLKTVSGIEIAGFFNGAADANGVWHNAGFYAYTLHWDATDKVFWLDPTARSQIKGHIQFTADDLANSIYSTLGNVGIYETRKSDPYKILDHAALTNSNGDPATMNTGENNQWGAVLVQFLTGFTAGYYGTAGQPLNPLISDTIDLNQNINWDPTYAFGANLSGAQPKFQDAYSRVLFENSNSYGSGYSDNLMQHYAEGGPLLSMSDPATGKNVASIGLTIYDDSETPGGYVTPTIHNYTAPGASGYVVPTALSGNSVGLSLANATVVAKDATKLSLDILTGTDGTGAPIWHNVAFTPGAGETLWQNWAIGTDKSGAFIAKPAGGASNPGQLLITQLPGTEDGTYWFRLNVGEGHARKTFNLYTEIDDGAFLNPLHSGQADALAVDGLATIAPPVIAGTPATVSTFNINFLYASTTTIAAENLVYNDKAVLPAPDAPVVGTLAGGTFKALAGQTSPVANTVSATTAKLAFSWVGGNDDPGTPAWISGATNKICALNFARVEFGPGSHVAPIHTKADLDGQWQTAATTLGNGTYHVTMREFLASDTKLKAPIGTESQELTLHVDVTKKALAAAGGSALELAPGGAAVPGNFVDLAVVEAPVTPGAVVVVYLVDAGGNLVDEATGATGATLAEATVATLGAHRLGDGTVTLEGRQSVYLPSDLRLAFATLTGEDSVEMAPPVAVSVALNGTADLTVGGFTLTARTDNTLSPDAMLASAQRQTDAPLVYLEEGAHLLLEATGSTDGTNRLAFVRAELDAETDAFTVGGVAPGEAGFKAAVRVAIERDAFFKGEGDFARSSVWTVAGETGFYAPVLLSETGEALFGPDDAAFRFLGDNTFAFDDGHGGFDFDFDDMVVRLSPFEEPARPVFDGWAASPLLAEDRAVIAPGAHFVSARGDGDPFADDDFGLTLVRSEAADMARLRVGGTAFFRNDSDGVLVEGGAAALRIVEGGRLVRRPDGNGEVEQILTVNSDDADVRLRNDGIIRGDVTLDGGDDLVIGAGDFRGTLFLGPGDDTVIFAGDRPLSLFMGRGEDTFRANGTGPAVVRGGRDDDTLTGGVADETLVGGLGDDVLRGRAGNDILAGYAGADRHVIDRQNGDDIIRGFERGLDVIDLTAFALAAGEAGDRIAMAQRQAGPEAVRLDLGALGGDGSVLVRGSAADLDIADFLI